MGHKIFDAHLHIIDPGYPLYENNGYMPPAFTVSDYARDAARLNIAGGAVVSGSFQRFDQGFLVAALRALGDNFVGVTQIPAETTDEAILRLDDAGVRAVRFNVARGGSAPLDDLERLARRVHEIAGWHSEFYIDTRMLEGDLGRRIAGLPSASIDHLGLHADGLAALLTLVEKGVKVKATGFGRVQLDPVTTMRAIMVANPESLMAGTDLPSTRAPRPFQDSDFELIRNAFDDDEIDSVLWGNAARFYLHKRRNTRD